MVGRRYGFGGNPYAMNPEYHEDDSLLRSTLGSPNRAPLPTAMEPSMAQSMAGPDYLTNLLASPPGLRVVSTTVPTLSRIVARAPSDVDTRTHAQQTQEGHVTPLSLVLSSPPRSGADVELKPQTANGRQGNMISYSLPQAASLGHSMDLGQFTAYDTPMATDHSAIPAHRGPSTGMTQTFGLSSPSSVGQYAAGFGFQAQLQVMPQFVSDPNCWHPGYVVPSEDSKPTSTIQAAAPAHPSLNSLPAEKVTYRPYSARFASMAAVQQFEGRVRWRPLHSEGLPATDAEMAPYVERIYAAIVNFSGFHDKIESRNKLNRLVAQRYSQEEIEAKCWQTVRQAVELHRFGAKVPVSVDPTMELRTPGRKEGRGEGEAAYDEKKKAREDRDWTFEQRIVEICKTVQVSKAAATDILDGIKLFSIVMAPKTARATKEDNRKNNAQKQESINRGKAVTTAQSGRSDGGPVQSRF